jgi:lipopolysaccharide/colanic/teichoic acid biosynthesis glycosyltransferase
MEKFFNDLVSTWWGILIICVLAVAVWVLLSALLYRQFFKRFYDIVLSGLALIVFSPLLIILTVVGAIKMKGNPFFTQLRPGKNEKIFRLIKFRTMTCEKDESGNLLPDEQRLTKYGKLLRSTSLDELPELFNIFIGQMSIVGPRPLLVKDMLFMTEEQRKRHSVRQGLTGLAQVNGRNCISWEDKLNYDLKYIEKITLWKDVKIIFLTVFKVFKRSDVVREGTESDIDYGDWLLKEGKITEEEYCNKIGNITGE